MNRFGSGLLMALVIFGSPALHAEEAVAPAATETQTAPPAAPASEATPAPVVAAPVATETPAPIPAAPAETESVAADNLEFISGEISALDEASKSVSVRLYGETEAAAAEKVLKVTVDENTDITDGEQDRDLKSLTAGTEVDVEYDPATNKATYIFVY